LKNVSCVFEFQNALKILYVWNNFLLLQTLIMLQRNNVFISCPNLFSPIWNHDLHLDLLDPIIYIILRIPDHFISSFAQRTENLKPYFLLDSDLLHSGIEKRNDSYLLINLFFVFVVIEIGVAKNKGFLLVFIFAFFSNLKISFSFVNF